MSGTSLLRDAKVFLKAVMTNQVARIAPDTYMRLTGETGRGSKPTSAEEVAEYFWTCFEDYSSQLADVGVGLDQIIRGQEVLEYGPGDLPGVALLMYAHGAARVTCVDRFDLVQISPRNAEILQVLLRRLTPAARQRVESAFVTSGDPRSGFRPDAIRYVLGRDGCVGEVGRYSLVYSRAVLEHVNDLEATFADMTHALRPGGIAVHEVDLKSHGLHRDHPLDFLCWQGWAWSVMHSHKGYPNRWRMDRYLELARRPELEIRGLEVLEKASNEDVAAIHARLAPPFRGLSPEDLSCLSFWLILERV